MISDTCKCGSVFKVEIRSYELVESAQHTRWLSHHALCNFFSFERPAHTNLKKNFSSATSSDHLTGDFPESVPGVGGQESTRSAAGSTLYLCNHCGAERERTEMGSITNGKGTYFYCHPSLSSGETCYTIMSRSWGSYEDSQAPTLCKCGHTKEKHVLMTHGPRKGSLVCFDDDDSDIICECTQYQPQETHTLVGGQVVSNVHDISVCEGRRCCIHNYSDHHMKDWTQNWREDRYLMERICPHGVGHPDPDDINPDKVHGCDGCCSAPCPDSVSNSNGIADGPSTNSEVCRECGGSGIREPYSTSGTACTTCNGKGEV